MKINKEIFNKGISRMRSEICNIAFNEWVLRKFGFTNKDEVKLGLKGQIDFIYKRCEISVDVVNYSPKEIFFAYFMQYEYKNYKDRSSKRIPLNPKPKKSYIKKVKLANNDTFYLSSSWQRVRLMVYSIYNPGVCMKCKKHNTETHIDHILPRSKYPELELDIHNMQVLCKECNIKKSNTDFTDYRTLENKKKCSIKFP